MTGEQITGWLDILPYVSAVLVFGVLVLLSVEYPPQIVLRSCEELRGVLQKRSQNTGWYRNTARWLEKNGGNFHYGKWMNPTSYLALKIILAGMGMTVVSQISVGYGVMAAILLFLIPGWLLMYLNKKDNRELLPEIKLVYHALEIQIRAGVYVTDALAECYGSVRHRRLRQALLDLAGDIVIKADIYEALGKLQGKFDNTYVNSLCITILQALESGQAVELLGDIAEQIKDMESLVLERRKGALERRITMYQLGVLAAVMGVVLYVCITHMYSAAVDF